VTNKNMCVSLYCKYMRAGTCYGLLLPARSYYRKNGMKLLFIASAALMGSCMFVSAEKAVDKSKSLTGDDVLRIARERYSSVNQSFEGQLRHDKKKIPFLLSLKPRSINFRFSSPDQRIQLMSTGDKPSLRESVGLGAKFKAVKPEWYRERIRGTDVTFDDISMRFLYWPKAKIIEEAKIKFTKAWVIEIRNPDGQGEYGSVRVWIDKKGKGLIKMEGFEPIKNRKIKELNVQHVKKIGDIWMVDRVRIDTIDFETGDRISRTYLEILK